VRVRLKGITGKRVIDADGRVQTYWYAWRGGGAPRLRGEPGTPEFIASYNEAVARKLTPQTGVLSAIIERFKTSEAFGDLADRTKADYLKKIRLIEKEFGTFPLAALTDKRSREVFRTWRYELARTSRRQADYAFAVLSLILAWALDNGLVDANPCTRMGRLYGSSRSDKIWTEADEANFNAKAPAHMHLPLLMALWTGQRQGDLLALKWWSYDGTHTARSGVATLIVRFDFMLVSARLESIVPLCPLSTAHTKKKSTPVSTISSGRNGNDRATSP
jgi:hypothetical protein